MERMIRFFFIIFWGLFSTFATAQTPIEDTSSPLQIEKIVPGLLGAGRYDCWVPIWVHLKSTFNTTTKVRLEIQSGSSSALTLSKEIEVPARGVAPFVIHPVFLIGPASYSFHVKVICENPKLELQKKEHFAVLSRTEPFLGVLTQKNSSLNAGQLKYLENQAPKKASTRLQIHTIPETEAPFHWFLYQNLDVLFILELDALSLIKSQEEAIVDWVRAGGTLFINGGDQAHSLKKGFLKSLIRFQRKSELQKLTHFPKEYFLDPYQKGTVPAIEPFSEETPQPYRVLVETPEANPFPLLIEQPIENGKILFSTVDLTKEPFKQNVALFKYLLDPCQELFFSDCNLLTDPSHLYESFFSSIQMKKGTFLGISLFLLMYILGLFWTHYRLSKGKLSIETKIGMLPKNILFFSLFAFILVLSFSPTQWKNQIHLLHFKANSTTAIQESLISFGLSESATIEAIPEKTGYADEVDIFEFDPARLLPFEFLPQPPPKIIFSDCKQGVARSFRYVSLNRIPENQHLKILLEPKERNSKLGNIKSLQLQIENHWLQPIEHLTIFGDSVYLPLGTLEVKASREQEVPILQEKISAVEYSPFGGLSFEAQRESFLRALYLELRNSTASSQSDWDIFHVIGFVKIPDNVSLLRNEKPLIFERENTWTLLHYQFIFPRHILPKNLPSNPNPNPQEEDE